MPERPEPAPRSFLDTPAEVDEFGSHDKIATILKSYIKSDQPRMMISLRGEYGAGKSTVIYLLRQKLLEDQTCKFLVFDAWAHTGESLRHEFLRQLTTTLSESPAWIDESKSTNKLDELRQVYSVEQKQLQTKVHPYTLYFLLSAAMFGIGSTLIKYATDFWFSICFVLTVSPIVFLGFLLWIIIYEKKHEKTDVLQTLMGYSNPQNNTLTITESRKSPTTTTIDFESYYEHIVQESLKNDDNKRLVIVFDNLDRLTLEDQRTVWSTISLFSSPNLSKEHDRVWIIFPLSNNGAKSTEAFSKLFQLTIDVPLANHSNWKKYLSCRLLEIDQAITNIEINSIYRIILALRQNNTGPTIRDVIRFLNHFSLHYEISKEYDLSIASIATYSILSSNNDFQIETALTLSGNVPVDILDSLPSDIDQELLAIHFQTSIQDALELYLRGPIENYLTASIDLHEKYLSNDSFWIVMQSALDNKELTISKFSTLACLDLCIHSRIDDVHKQTVAQRMLNEISNEFNFDLEYDRLPALSDYILNSLATSQKRVFLRNLFDSVAITTGSDRSQLLTEAALEKVGRGLASFSLTDEDIALASRYIDQCLNIDPTVQYLLYIYYIYENKAICACQPLREDKDIVWTSDWITYLLDNANHHTNAKNALFRILDFSKTDVNALEKSCALVSDFFEEAETSANIYSPRFWFLEWLEGSECDTESTWINFSNNSANWNQFDMLLDRPDLATELALVLANTLWYVSSIDHQLEGKLKSVIDELIKKDSTHFETFAKEFADVWGILKPGRFNSLLNKLEFLENNIFVNKLFRIVVKESNSINILQEIVNKESSFIYKSLDDTNLKMLETEFLANGSPGPCFQKMSVDDLADCFRRILRRPACSSKHVISNMISLYCSHLEELPDDKFIDEILGDTAFGNLTVLMTQLPKSRELSSLLYSRLSRIRAVNQDFSLPIGTRTNVSRLNSLLSKNDLAALRKIVGEALTGSGGGTNLGFGATLVGVLTSNGFSKLSDNIVRNIFIAGLQTQNHLYYSVCRSLWNHFRYELEVAKAWPKFIEMLEELKDEPTLSAFRFE